MMRGHRGLERCAGGHMEADEWERTACGEIKERSTFGERNLYLLSVYVVSFLLLWQFSSGAL